MNIIRINNGRHEGRLFIITDLSLTASKVPANMLINVSIFLSDKDVIATSATVNANGVGIGTANINSGIAVSSDAIFDVRVFVPESSFVTVYLHGYYKNQ